MMIVFDLETTDLMKPGVSPKDQQPHIIEFAAIRLDPETLEELDSLEFLVNPGIPIPEEAKKITGISDDMVKKQPPFVAYYRQLCDFFLGAGTMVAHNAPFDTAVLVVELERIGKQYLFPYAPQRLCTVEMTSHITGKPLKLHKLYEHAFGKEPKPTRHRAMGDVEILVDVVRWMRKEKLI